MVCQCLHMLLHELRRQRYMADKDPWGYPNIAESLSSWSLE